MDMYLPNEVQRALNTVIRTLGDTFSFDMLKELTELLRGKPLYIEEDTMPVAMSGYCIALQDADLICTRAGLDEILVRAARLHEIAHLLLGHIPQLSNGVQTPSYSEFVQRRSDLYGATYRLHTTAYDTPQEHCAEILATLLHLCISRYESSAPPLARDVYG